MYKSIDRFLIGYNNETDVVTVAAQVFLVRTDNPDETVVAYDAKQLKYIADFDGHDLGDNRRYALYAPERKDFANFFSVSCPEHNDSSNYFKVNLKPFVDELNRQEVPLTDRLIAQIENKMQASWYGDFANKNDLIPLDEIKKMIEAHNEKAQNN